MRLNSRAFLETPIHQSPHIKFEWLQGDAEDLIVLTGGPEGPISLAIDADHADLAATRCDRLASLFGDRLYIELQRHGIDKERRAEAGLIDIAYAKGIPLVATNEPYFAAADDYEAHDALLCIAGGRLIAETDRDQLTPDHRFKTRAEMAVLFADVPDAYLPAMTEDPFAARLHGNEAASAFAELPGIRRGLVMVQAEVAERLAAAPGSRTYGVPSAKLAWFAAARRAGPVPRSVFWPVPGVKVAVMKAEFVVTTSKAPVRVPLTCTAFGSDVVVP